jgi:Putative Ig domain/Secretion system C-terminal sorting domain/NHL repeat
MKLTYISCKKRMSLFFLGTAVFQLHAQLPDISYTTPNVFYIGQTIPLLEPINAGGVVNAEVLVSTFAGSGNQGATNGNGTAASFKFPTYVAFDALNNLVVVDRSNHLIRKIMPNGDVTTYAGTGAIGIQNGDAATATFKFPDAAVTDSNGNLFITDQSNHMIRKITPEGIVSTFAGTGILGSNDGDGATASFYYPAGITVDGDDNLYIADFGNNKVRKITPGGIVSTFAGTGTVGSTNDTALLATFNGLTGVAIDSENNVFVADYYNNIIRKIDALGMVTTFSGTGIAGSTDGVATAASFNRPASITIDSHQNLFVTDENNNKIRKIDSNGTTSTYAGIGTIGSDDGVALTASFNHPTGLVIDGTVLYVADYSNHKIRKIDRYGYSISPALPNGLFFDEATGIISGTPAESFPATDFTIVATNSSGSDSFVVNLAVDTLSADEFSVDFIRIAPNPVQNSFSLIAEQPITSLHIYTALGQEVLSLNALSTSTIDASQWSKGVYFAAIRMGEAEKKITIVKE